MVLVFNSLYKLHIHIPILLYHYKCVYSAYKSYKYSIPRKLVLDL